MSDAGATALGITGRSTAALDISFLGLLVAICAAPYILGLGYYSDDWAFLAKLATHPDQSFFGLLTYFGSLENIAPRPLQALELVAFYKLFGINPTPGHFINHLVLWLGLGFLYLSARRMTGSRGFALALAVVYGSLPHFETTRFWFAAYQANTSLLFFGVGAYCLARHAEASRLGAGWLAAGLLAMSLSVLAYELFLPLFLGLPVVIWLLGRQGGGRSLPPAAMRDLIVQMSGGAAVAIAVVVFKLAQDAGAHQWQGGNFPLMVAKLYLNAVRAEFFHMGALLPVHLAKNLATHGTLMCVAAGVAAALGVAAYLGGVERTESSLARQRYLELIRAGAVAFVAGYGVLVQNFSAIFGEGTGISNRVNIASGIGIALIVIGLVVALAQRLRPSFRMPAMLAVLAIGVGAGTMYNATSGVTWAEAARVADRTFAEVQRMVPDAEAGSSILLYGMCPYVGPAPVYASNWDLSGRLALWRGKRDVQANVLDAKSVVRPDGIVVYDYAMFEVYPYGPLQVIDLRPGYRDGCKARRMRSPISRRTRWNRPIPAGLSTELASCSSSRNSRLTRKAVLWSIRARNDGRRPTLAVK